jgi:hypothetical protein
MPTTPTPAAATARPRRPAIGHKPGTDPASAWVQQAGALETNAVAADAPASASQYRARLTIDVTPALRGRIKVIAFQRDLTVAEMLRDLLEQSFPEDRI